MPAPALLSETEKTELWRLGYATIQELETENGILASAREEIYGAIFGRDSLITALRLLRAHKITKDEYFLKLVRKILLGLTELQGRADNLESGEQLGKIIHEYRPSGHDHLTKRENQAWHVYPDNVMRNFDSVDSTPLFLIACARYAQYSRDEEFLTETQPYIQLALVWLLTYGDQNHDGFIDYHFSDQRKAGGLKTQNWMDSEESVFHEDDSPVHYPIAPVEVQAYSYLALRLWSARLEIKSPAFAREMRKRADDLKTEFNRVFLQRLGKTFRIASGIDGHGKTMNADRSSMGHCLWACLNPEDDGLLDCIVEGEYVPVLAKRLMRPDLFVSRAGIRTLSSRSRHYEAVSYHNGSIWPHDTSMVIEGLEQFGFGESAARIRAALGRAILHFGTPIELYVYDGELKEYRTPTGQVACRKQAWCAASLLVEAAS